MHARGRIASRRPHVWIQTQENTYGSNYRSDGGELRAKTDAPMMECKKALTEADGDMARAEEILRVKLGNKAARRRRASPLKAWWRRTSTATWARWSK